MRFLPIASGNKLIFLHQICRHGFFRGNLKGSKSWMGWINPANKAEPNCRLYLPTLQLTNRFFLVLLKSLSRLSPCVLHWQPPGFDSLLSPTIVEFNLVLWRAKRILFLHYFFESGENFGKCRMQVPLWDFACHSVFSSNF